MTGHQARVALVANEVLTERSQELSREQEWLAAAVRGGNHVRVIEPKEALNG